MDADAQVPALYVQEVDRAAAAAEDPHLLVRVCSTCRGPLCQMLMIERIINFFSTSHSYDDMLIP